MQLSWICLIICLVLVSLASHSLTTIAIALHYQAKYVLPMAELDLDPAAQAKPALDPSPPILTHNWVFYSLEPQAFCTNSRINVYWNLACPNFYEVMRPVDTSKIHGAEERLDLSSCIISIKTAYYAKALYTMLHLTLIKITNGRYILL